MNGMDLYNYPRRLEGALAKVNEAKGICEENKKSIFAFSKVRLAKGSSHGRVAKVVYCMRFMAIWLGKPFAKATKDDLINIVGELESNTNLKKSVSVAILSISAIFPIGKVTFLWDGVTFFIYSNWRT